MENSKDYRMDLWRLKQKLYETYPPGSAARKQMLFDEILYEYNNLYSTLSSYALVITHILVTKKSPIRIIFETISLSLSLSVTSTALFFMVTSLWMKIVFVLLFGGSVYFLVQILRSVLKTYTVIKKYLSIKRKLNKKLNYLQKRIL